MLVGLGVVLGRLWAWMVVTVQVPQCPKCSIEFEQRRTIAEISSFAKAGEARMRHVAQHANTDSNNEEGSV